MKRLFQHELCIPIVVMVIMLSLNAYPWIHRVYLQAPDHKLIPFHNNAGDYPTYVSAVKQGIDGHVFTHNMYVTAPHNASLYFIFYAALGLIGRALGTGDAHLVYHISRYILGIIWCVAAYSLIRQVLKTKFERVLAFALFLTSAGLPRWVVVNGSPVLSTYMTWWTEFDPIRRVAFLPHYLMGHSLLAFALLFFLRAMEQKNFRLLTISIFCGWFAGLIHPPSLIILLLVLPVYSLLKFPIRQSLYWIVFCAISVTSLLLMNWQARQFPWSTSLLYESQSFALSIPELFLALGPVCLFAVIGILLRWKNKYVPVLVLWIGMSIGMIAALKMILTYAPNSIFRIFPLSNIRFLQTALWLPLAILAANAFGYIKMKRGTPVVVIFLAVLFGITVSGYPTSLRTQIVELSLAEEYHEPDAGWFEALKSLDRLTIKGPILSLHWEGALIPTYTSRVAYVGNDVVTPAYDQQMGRAYKFFTGLPVCDAYKIVHDAGVAAVLYGFDEIPKGASVLEYPFLRQYSKYGSTIVFTVIPWDDSGCK